MALMLWLPFELLLLLVYGVWSHLPMGHLFNLSGVKRGIPSGNGTLAPIV